MKLTIQPPPSPNRDKYPFVGTVTYKGLTIDLENLAGSVREGTGPTGQKWKTAFSGAHYGEIRGSNGVDGDPLDVYLKEDPEDTDLVYVVHQNHPGNHPSKPGKWDEDKVVLGARSIEEAEDLYLRHYTRKDFLRSITVMDFGKFKKYIFGENKKEKVAMVTRERAYTLGVQLALNKAGFKKTAAPFVWPAWLKKLAPLGLGTGLLGLGTLGVYESMMRGLNAGQEEQQQ